MFYGDFLGVTNHELPDKLEINFGGAFAGAGHLMSADVPCHWVEGQNVRTCTLQDVARALKNAPTKCELGQLDRSFLASDLLLRLRVNAAGDVVFENIIGLRIMPMRDHTASLL